MPEEFIQRFLERYKVHYLRRVEEKGQEAVADSSGYVSCDDLIQNVIETKVGPLLTFENRQVLVYVEPDNLHTLAHALKQDVGLA